MFHSEQIWSEALPSEHDGLRQSKKLPTQRASACVGTRATTRLPDRGCFAGERPGFSTLAGVAASFEGIAVNDQEQPENGVDPAAEEQVLAMGAVNEELEEDLDEELLDEFDDGDDLDESEVVEHVRSLVEEIFDEDDLGEVLSEFDVLTLEDAAAYLKVEYGAIRRMIKEQGLPGRKIGEEWRFLRGAIADWLRAPGGNAPAVAAPVVAAAAAPFQVARPAPQEQRESNRPPLRERFSQEGQQGQGQGGSRYPQQGGSRYPQQGGTRYPQENRPPRRPYQNEGGGQGYQGGGQGYQGGGQGYQSGGGGQGYPPPRRPRYGNDQDQGGQGQAPQGEYRPPRRPYAGQGGAGQGGAGQGGGQGGGSSAGPGSYGGQRFGGGPKKPKRKSLNEQRFNRLDRRKFGEESSGEDAPQDSGD